MYSTDKLKDYLYHRLSKAEMEAIEAAIKEDAQLAESVRELKQWLLLDQLETQAHLAEAIDFAHRAEQNRQIRRKIIPWILGAAAVISLTLVVAPLVIQWIWPPEKTEIQPNSDEPNNENTEPPNTVLPGVQPPVASDNIPTRQHRDSGGSIRNGPVDNEALIANLLRDYKEQNIAFQVKDTTTITSINRVSADFGAADFNRALALYRIRALDSMLSMLSGCEKADCYFLAGHGYFEKGAYEQATTSFRKTKNKITSSRSFLRTPYGTQLDYYLFLCHLATKNWPDFQKQYELLKERPDDDYFPKAEQIWLTIERQGMLDFRQGMLMLVQVSGLFEQGYELFSIIKNRQTN